MCVKHKQNWNAEKIKTANRKQTGHSKKKKQRAEGKLDKYLWNKKKQLRNGKADTNIYTHILSIITVLNFVFLSAL